MAEHNTRAPFTRYRLSDRSLGDTLRYGIRDKCIECVCSPWEANGSMEYTSNDNFGHSASFRKDRGGKKSSQWVGLTTTGVL